MFFSKLYGKNNRSFANIAGVKFAPGTKHARDDADGDDDNDDDDDDDDDDDNDDDEDGNDEDNFNFL
jgi:hypothetical protein